MISAAKFQDTLLKRTSRQGSMHCFSSCHRRHLWFLMVTYLRL